MFYTVIDYPVGLWQVAINDCNLMEEFRHLFMYTPVQK